MVEFLPGAEPSRILIGGFGGAGDQLRFVVERAGIGIFDRDSAVLETWKRWGTGSSMFSYPISTAPPADVRAGVIDVNIRKSGTTVAQAVEDSENVAGIWANIVSVRSLTKEAIRSGDREREEVRKAAIEEGAGAGFQVVTRPFKTAFANLERSAKTVLVVAGLGALAFLVFQTR